MRWLVWRSVRNQTVNSVKLYDGAMKREGG